MSTVRATLLDCDFKKCADAMSEEIWDTQMSDAEEWLSIGESEEASVIARSLVECTIEGLNERQSLDKKRSARFLYAWARAEHYHRIPDKNTVSLEYAIAALVAGREGAGIPARRKRCIQLAVASLGDVALDNVGADEDIWGIVWARLPQTTSAVVTIIRFEQADTTWSQLVPLPNGIKIQAKDELASLAGHKASGVISSKVGWHELLPAAVTAFQSDYSRLIDACSLFVNGTDVVSHNRLREDVIKSAKGFARFASFDAHFLDLLIELLSNRFSTHWSERESTQTAGFDRLVGQLTSLLDAAYEKPSNLRSCLLVPVLESLQNTITTDHRDRIEKCAPDWVITLAKLYYPLNLPDQLIDVNVNVVNRGTLEVKDCTIEFTINDEDKQALSMVTATWYLGTMPVSSAAKSATFRLKVLSSTVSARVSFTLTWTSWTGKANMSGELRLAAQRAIDWARHTENPYKLLPVDSLDRLKGRDAVLADLYNGLLSGQSYRITGQKRVGKSSIAKALEVRLHDRNWVTIELRWGRIAGGSAALVYRTMARLIDAEVRKRSLPRKHEISVPPRADFEENASAAFHDFLDAMRLALPDIYLLLVIDDFDELEEELYLGAMGDSFFKSLRSIVNESTVRLVFVGGEKLKRIWQFQGDRLNVVLSVSVDYLEKPEDYPGFQELVKYPVRDTLEIEDRAINRIFALTSGNPFYATLICNRIYARALKSNITYVDEHDVDMAANTVAQEADEGQFAHFWKDGPHAGTSDEPLIARLNQLVLIAIADTVENSLASAEISRVLAHRALKPEKHDLVEKVLDQLIGRRIIRQVDNRVSMKVPIFAEWLRGEGSVRLREALFADELILKAQVEKYAITDDALGKVASGLVYRSEPINEIKIRNWLRQFGGPKEQLMAFKILSRIKETGYISASKLQTLAGETYERVIADANKRVGFQRQVGKGGFASNLFLVTSDEPGESGGSVIRAMRDEARVRKANFGSLNAVAKTIRDSIHDPAFHGLVLVVNDVIASGESAIEDLRSTINAFDQQLPGWRSILTLYYMAVAGYSRSIELLREKYEDVPVMVGLEFGHEIVAFDASAGIFDDEIELQQAKTLFTRIGTQLEEKHPLGHNGSQMLILLPDNCPNNSLPPINKFGEVDGKQWQPLFARI